MEVAGQTVSLPALIALGVAVGLIAGVFGVGGGFILTPLLSAVLGIPVPIAVGTGLCQMVGTASVALLRHRKLAQGDERFGLLMAAPSLVGVATGAHCVKALSELGNLELAGQPVPIVTLVLYIAFILFLLGGALAMWQRGSARSDELEYVRRGPFARLQLGPLVDLPAVRLSRVSAFVIAYSGLGLGFLSGLLGVGGGIALIPLLLYGFGFPIRHAAGTGISVLLVTAIVGTLVHAAQGHVHLGLALVLLVGASISAQVGAELTSKLPARFLRQGFIWVIGVAIFSIVWDVVRRVV